MAETSAVYHPRSLNLSQYYQCVEDHFETLEQVHDERFSRQYGFFRPYVLNGSFTGILTVASCTMVLQGSNAVIAGMSFYWRFHANVVTSARHVIRSG